MTQLIILLILLVFVGGCDYNITFPSSSNSNTNTNSVTSTVDIHDIVNFVPVPNPTDPVPINPTNPNGGSEVPLPLPASGQGIALNVASSNPTALQNSCQATNGVSAWAFLDTVIGALKVSDARWGYVVNRNTNQVSQDTIGYRATSDNLGAWAVDIILNHCSQSPTFSWNVLGFDVNTIWTPVRTN